MLEQWRSDFPFLSESRRWCQKFIFASYRRREKKFPSPSSLRSQKKRSPDPLDKDKCRENPAWFGAVTGRRGKLREFSLVLINDLTDFPGEWHEARSEGEGNPVPRWIRLKHSIFLYPSTFFYIPFAFAPIFFSTCSQILIPFIVIVSI